MRRDLGALDVSKAASQLDALDISVEGVSKLRTRQAASVEEKLDPVSSEKYPARRHAKKVAKELGAKDGLIYLPGKPTLLYEDSDMTPDFRQRKYFYYITGVNVPDCAATYDISSSTLTLWIPFVEPRQALYFGSPPDPQQAKRLYDVDEIRYTEDLPGFIRCHLPTHTLFLLHPPSSSDGISSILRASSSDLDTTSLLPAMNRARVVKDEHELGLIRRACQISAIGHRQIAKRLLELSNERDVHAIFSAACIARAAPSMAYQVIAGAGENASTLHYIDNNADLEGNDLIVVDAGCEYRGYASDITRTLPIGGEFKGKAAEIHAIVQDMQEACIKAAKPGKPYYELHVLAADIALDGLLELGILKGDREKIRRQGTVSAFFPHGLGHHVGLEVHDVSGDLPLMSADAKATMGIGAKREVVSAKSLIGMMNDDVTATRPRAPLEPNMVVTIEPGIYFCRPYIQGYFLERPDHARFIDTDVLEEYYPVGGARIEDVILIKEDGNENLSWRAPKGKELEDVINGRD